MIALRSPLSALRSPLSALLIFSLGLSLTIAQNAPEPSAPDAPSEAPASAESAPQTLAKISGQLIRPDEEGVSDRLIEMRERAARALTHQTEFLQAVAEGKVDPWADQREAVEKIQPELEVLEGLRLTAADSSLPTAEREPSILATAPA